MVSLNMRTIIQHEQHEQHESSTRVSRFPKQLSNPSAINENRVR